MNKLKPHVFHPPKRPPPVTPPPTTTKEFNSTINRLSADGLHHEALRTYNSMLKSNATPPDAFTYPSLLKTCISLNQFSLGLNLHQHVIVNGFSSDPYISSSLINFYAKFRHTSYAQKVFDTMPFRDTVPWTAITGCYARAGDMKNAFFMYSSMRYQGIEPNPVTILTLLSGVSEGVHVDILHACVIKYSFTCDVVVMNCMLNVYAKLGRVEDARYLFEMIKNKDLVSWNSLINAYSTIENVKEITKLFLRMRLENVEPDQQTFGSLVTAVTREGSDELGRIAHGQTTTAGFEPDKHVQTSLVVMYLRSGNVDVAFQIFERVRDKDMVLWTAIIAGLVQNECADKALAMFQRMLVLRAMPSSATMACTLAACGQLGSTRQGTSIHCYMLRHKMVMDIPVKNSLVSMYAKCGCLEKSFAVFSKMQERDVVSWNAMVAGYAQNGYLDKALLVFSEMRAALQRPDSVTVVSLLQACAYTGAYQQGKWIHNFMVRSFVVPCIMVNTALVDMYAKCGDLDSARKCFDRMPQHDLVSWSTIIAGYGSHGKGETALEMYSEFLENGFVPNDVIFLSVLCACSHNGLVDLGMSLFESMKNDYKIEPKAEHCACIIDLLCRAGQVEGAYDFYKRMFSEPMVDVLGIILDACHSDDLAELRDVIAKEISNLRPTDAGKYVQLAHSFASTGRWDGVGHAWGQMKSLGLRKLPAWSLIEVQGTITRFFMRQSSHPQYDNIVSVLKNLTHEIQEQVLNSDQEDIAFHSNVL